MTPSRTQAVDAIRGVALFGICVVNLPYLALPLDVLANPPTALPDRIASFAVEALFQGKFFVLFSFLFGWGFGQQLAAAAQRGADPWQDYRRRLLGLGLFGLAHAVLVFHGDILILYALLGLALWPLRDAPVRRLLAVAAGMVPVAFVVYLGLGVILADAAAWPAAGPSGYLGGWTDAVGQRLGDWTLALPFVLMFNGPLAFGAFALGLAAQRSGFFEAGSPGQARLRRAAPLLALVAVPANLAYALSLSGFLADDAAALLAFAALALGAPTLAALYLLGILALARRIPAIGTAGRMSLTAYVAEGVVAGLIFNGVGLGLHGQLGQAALLAVAAGVFAVVHLGCHLWLSRFRTGPLEALLRALIRGGRR